MTQASSRTLAPASAPLRSKAAVTRSVRSGPAAMKVATASTTTRARIAQGSWIESRGVGRPARMRLIEASVRSRCACHSARATGSCVASVSVSVVAGRCLMPLPRSSRSRASLRVGQRNRTSGSNDAISSATKMRSPTARPASGRDIQAPIQETARKNPASVTTRARCGQTRSHAKASWARCTAFDSCKRAAGSLAPEAGVSDDRLNNKVSGFSEAY